MRWFTGWVPGPGCTDVVLPTPRGGRPIWVGARPLWTVGDWSGRTVRTVEVGGCRAAALGVCLASEAELATAVADARQAGDYTRLGLLPGNSVIVVADEQAVTVVTDLAGLHPVFYTPWEGGYWFASSPLPLVDLTDVGPDVDWLATSLLCSNIPGMAGDRSSFTRIARSRPGHVLTFTGGAPSQEPIPLPLGGTSFADGAAALRTALATAVSRRAELWPQMTTDLSGGLDSSTLALLAAPLLSGPLPAVTYVDPISGSADDLAYARLCADTEPALTHMIIHGDDACLPYAGLGSGPLLDEPSQEVLFIGRTRARLTPARDHGTNVHLSGDGGDAVLAGPLTYLADLARAGRVRALLREATAWARLRHRPARTLISAAVRAARTRYPDALKQAAARLRAGGPHTQRGVEDNLTWCDLSAAASWAPAPVRHTLADRIDSLRPAADPDFGADQAALTALQWGGGAARAFEYLVEQDMGVPVHVPFFDNQVVAACAQVAVTDRTTTAAAKPLLAAAFGGKLPDRLLTRRTKGDYTACMYAGLRQAGSYLRDLFTAPLLAEHGLIDPGQLIAALDDAVNGRHAPLAALNDVIAAELWLRQLDQARPYVWTSDTREVRAHAAAHAP